MDLPILFNCTPTYNRSDQIMSIVEAALSAQGNFEICMPGDGSTHDTLAWLSEINNPWLRLNRGGNGGRGNDVFTAFLEKVAQRIEPLGLYNSVGLSQANPQCRWIMNPDSRVLVKEFWKLKKLEYALPDIRRKTSVKNVSGMLKKPSRKRFEFSSKDIVLILDIYQSDFGAFGYPPEPIGMEVL